MPTKKRALILLVNFNFFAALVFAQIPPLQQSHDDEPTSAADFEPPSITISKRAVPSVLAGRRASQSSSSSSTFGGGGFGSSRMSPNMFQPPQQQTSGGIQRSSSSSSIANQHQYHESDCEWIVVGAHATVATGDADAADANNIKSDSSHLTNSLFHPYASSKQCRAYIYRHSLYKQEFRLGYKLELVCYASGIPRPQITWKKGNKEITTQSSDNRHIHEYHVDEYSVKGKLEIDPSTQGDEGGYTCIASNAVGIDSKSFQAEFIKAT